MIRIELQAIWILVSINITNKIGLHLNYTLNCTWKWDDLGTSVLYIRMWDDLLLCWNPFCLNFEG